MPFASFRYLRSAWRRRVAPNLNQKVENATLKNYRAGIAAGKMYCCVNCRWRRRRVTRRTKRQAAIPIQVMAAVLRRAARTQATRTATRRAPARATQPLPAQRPPGRVPRAALPPRTRPFRSRRATPPASSARRTRAEVRLTFHSALSPGPRALLQFE